MCSGLQQVGLRDPGLQLTKPIQHVHCFLVILLGQVKSAQVVKCLAVIRLQLNRSLELFDGLIQYLSLICGAKSGIDTAQEKVGSTALRIQFDGFLALLYGAPVLSGFP